MKKKEKNRNRGVQMQYQNSKGQGKKIKTFIASCTAWTGPGPLELHGQNFPLDIYKMEIACPSYTRRDHSNMNPN